MTESQEPSPADSQPARGDRRFRLFGRELVMQPGEIEPFVFSALWFFVILVTVFVVRAMRETVSTIAGSRDLPMLWTYTFGFTIVANLAFWWLLSRVPRRALVTTSLLGCAGCLLVFQALLQTPDEGRRVIAAYAFYAWYSAFNMCIVSLFWVCMVSDFTEASARRMFGPIAVGGTLGALAGSGVASFSLDLVGQEGLLGVAAGGCLVATGVFWLREQVVAPLRVESPREPRRGKAELWAGIVLVVTNPTLRWFAALILVMTAAQTGFYFFQADFIAEALPEEIDRTAYYANKDVWTQALTLVFQVFLTTALLSFRITVALTVLPVLATLAIVGVEIAPSVLMFGMAHATWDAGRHGLLRPAREVLFTPLSADAKFKSKTFLDTVLYRGGDLAWGWFIKQWVATTWLLVAALSTTVAWIGIGVGLGRSHERGQGRDADRAEEEIPSRTSL